MVIPLWAIGAAAKAWSFIKSNPPLALCAVLACYGVWEHHRAQGWADYAHKLESASQAARKAQEALREQERKDYQEKADEADTEYRAALAGARSDTARYIAAHRVQPSHIGAAQPVGEADPAKQPADVSGAVVMVAEPDVQRCADWQAYGVAIHDWALSVSQ